MLQELVQCGKGAEPARSPIPLKAAPARGTQMVRIWVIGIALAVALAMPAKAQQRSVPQILERSHALCDQDYKPACIKLGFVI